MTRHVKLDAEKQQILCAMVSVGCTIRRAAELCECTEGAVRRLEERNPEFKARLQTAKQARELAALRQIREAGHKSWRAAAWLLERLNPRDFSEKNVPRTHFDLKPLFDEFEQTLRGNPNEESDELEEGEDGDDAST